MTITAGLLILFILVAAGAALALYGGRAAQLGLIVFGCALLALCFLLAGVH